MKSYSVKKRMLLSAVAFSSVGVLLAGCSGAGGAATEDGPVSLTLATVNNPQMKDMEELKGAFEEAHPDITVNFVSMEENDLRDAVTKDVATQGGQYDIVTVGSYEVPIWGQNDWLVDLGPLAEADTAYNVDDLLPPVREALTVDDSLYAVPFYGESSFLMYNQEMFAAAGLSMPTNPTWDEVAGFARTLKTDDVAGICLRGKPGWGELFAPLTTVVQTFGGGWFDEDWNATVNSPEFTEAVTFYTDLVKDAGEADPVSTGFTECLNLFSQGNAAMWYDATSAAGPLEADTSAVAGKVGYVHAPVKETDEAGWLWAWNLAIPNTSTKQDAAWEFVSWATSTEYIDLVGTTLGWERVPPGSRTSTYENPDYLEAAAAFAPITKDIMLAVNPTQPGVNPQPWVGIQYVTVPEFQDLGNQVSQNIADVFAGRDTVENVLDKGQELATTVGDAQK
ncbi:sugar ABC transporter substrate-binding protein [Cryobacterium roopkundense]|uniref:Sorbitol/mannitol transport system substrate-binding protein n=1 Tax=Cryobacterium roopkundense TaxID=1001240 RepID=A0A099JNE3_9MICO|nr:sugar ABC transporter substrate-binding protein [Cryobacterium roopkundense]KGJ79102.1 sugar ABC transporter substrate-binding protein [Cryobacterium roopkundense]MBB5643281.1 sorbitol/mannitol transport system substrate-binding protein [Cryobacterium roopkundense]